MAVGFDGCDGFDEGQAVIESEPLPGVTMPLDVEVAITAPGSAIAAKIRADPPRSNDGVARRP